MDVSREHLRAYVDDALSEIETARLETMLRNSEPLRQKLHEVVAERERGDHSVGAIWRNERLTCPTREQLGSYLMEVLDADLHRYVEFHLEVVECAGCLANLDDLREHQAGPPPQAKTRRKRYYQSSAGLLKKR